MLLLFTWQEEVGGAIESLRSLLVQSVVGGHATYIGLVLIARI